MIYASSALAANTLARSIVASVLPVLAHPLLDNLGTEWGGTHAHMSSSQSPFGTHPCFSLLVSIFAFLSLGLLPIPLIFVRYGSRLREKSHFAREAREVIAATRNQIAQDVAEEDPAPMSEMKEKRNMDDLERGDGVEVNVRSSIEKNINE